MLWTAVANLPRKMKFRLLPCDPSLSIDRLNVTRRLMNAVLPDATVFDYERHIPAINLPDDDDRHVVAAVVVAAIANARQNLLKSNISAVEFIKTLSHQKLRKFAAAMNAHRS